MDEQRRGRGEGEEKGGRRERRRMRQGGEVNAEERKEEGKAAVDLINVWMEPWSAPTLVRSARRAEADQ